MVSRQLLCIITTYNYLSDILVRAPYESQELYSLGTWLFLEIPNFISKNKVLIQSTVFDSEEL